VTGSKPAAVFGALAFACAPFIFARFAHIQLLMTAGIPLAMLAWHRLVERPGIDRGVALGLVLFAQAMSCGYYGIFAGLMVGLGAVFYAVSRRLYASAAYWISIGIAAATSIVLVAPFLIPYFALRETSGFARSLEDAAEYPANWQAYLASSAWAHEWMLPFVKGWSEVLFPGFLTIVLGVWGGIWVLRRQTLPASVVDDRATADRPRETAGFYALVGVLAFWSSFGPAGGLYTLLYHLVPVFSFLRAPSRLGLLVTFSLVVCASLWVAGASRRYGAGRARLVAGGLTTALFLELLSIPLPFVPAPPIDRVYTRLAALPPGTVAEFPFFWLRSDFPRHALYMLNSTTHWRWLVNGYSDNIPEDFRASVVPLSSFPTRESFAILKRHRTRHVLFHLRFYDTRSREKLKERLGEFADYVRPIDREGDVWLYEIVKWPG